jgi:3'(2'), 5'-bisphosphate nucleotidase
MSQSYATEEQVAVSAVRRACQLTSSVFNTLLKGETITKDDKSPVTIADYAAQAVISTILQAAFPDDPIVGEEDASTLRFPNTQAERDMRDRIVQLANDALTSGLMLGDNKSWGIGPGMGKSDTEILDAIDAGRHEGGPEGRMWTIDPVDGTKGFLRGDQYAVCVSLIIDSQVKLGVIGCPNLPVDQDDPEAKRGCIFVAIKGHGTRQLTLSGANPTPLRLSPSTAMSSVFLLESFEAAHSSHSLSSIVSSNLSISKPPLRMDSQAKYGCLARSKDGGGVYLRMPTGAGYREKIWDHAPGQLIVEEAGGVVTDSRGESLNFGLGRTLGENYGIIACAKEVHPRLLEAVQQAVAGESAKA